MTDALDSLKSLHTTLIDSRNGYQEALDDAGRTGMTDLFQRMIALRERHASELTAHLVAAGATPNQQGSFMTMVHRTVISFQSLFGDLNERIIPGLIDGEKRIVSTYDDTLRSASSIPTGQLVKRQRADVVEIIADMERRSKSAA